MIIMNMKSVFDRWIIILYLFAVLISVVSSTKKNLYTLLGLSSTASQSMIKKAYRGKARDTHPDKNPTMDPLVAAENFREIVEAYETLSDLKARNEYDRTGRAAASQRKNEQNQGGNRNQGFNWGWKFGFNQGSHQERQHGLLFDRIYRTQIIDAQSRVISILSLDHLKSTALAGDDSEFYDEHSIEQRLERYVLLAFYDSSIPACEHRLTSQVLFPWPYAGYSNENYGTSSVWWDEIMLTGKVDLRNKGSSDEKRKLGEYFGIRDGTLTAQNCPSVVLLPRGGYLSERSTATLQYVKISEEFRKFVWPKLKMKIRFENKTPWPLSVWWLDGTRGIKQPEIAVNEATDMNTFLSHSFFFRANWVTGNSLTNQSGLLWYTAIMKDDNTVFKIESRCFDHSGDCVRWQQEGFCDHNSDTYYVRKNPDWGVWVRNNCFVSCKTGCGAVKSEKRSKNKKTSVNSNSNSEESKRNSPEL